MAISLPSPALELPPARDSGEDMRKRIAATYPFNTFSGETQRELIDGAIYFVEQYGGAPSSLPPTKRPVAGGLEANNQLLQNAQLVTILSMFGGNNG